MTPGPAPAAVRRDTVRLVRALDDAVPAKALDRNLLIATWNIRALGSHHPGWVADARTRPKRDLASLLCIAEIISRFDVVALQEVRADTASLRVIHELLGEHWSLILSDVTEGSLGNGERLAFLFDNRRVRLSGLACEIIIPPEHLERARADELQRQFARTPYAVGFRIARHTITLVALHVLWGNGATERVRELRSIAQWLAAWSRDPNAWDHNLITLGDFNIDRHGGRYDQAFTSTGLHVPDGVRAARRSVFDRAASPRAAYDQIAWFEGVNEARPLTLTCTASGSFDFRDAALRSRRLTPTELSWRLSDHLPLWVEFEVPP